MKNTAVILGILTALSIVACGGSSGGGGGGVESRIKAQSDYLNEKDYQKLWETCSPEWRKNADYDSWKEEAQGTLMFMGILDKKTSFTDIETDLRGDTTIVSYKWRTNDVVIHVEEDERWVRVEGEWYQENCD